MVPLTFQLFDPALEINNTNKSEERILHTNEISILANV